MLRVLLRFAILVCGTMPAAAQFSLTNGGSHPGSITVAGQIDRWTISAQAGDYAMFRVGTAGFSPYLRLYGPGDVLVASVTSSVGDQVKELIYTFPFDGTYTLAMSPYFGTTGTYVLHFAKVPGGFSVGVGDEGGPLQNGANHPGAITRGDLDMWSYSLSAGQTAILRIGTVGISPHLRLFSPSGQLVAFVEGNGGDQVREIAHVSAAGGSYTLIVGAWFGFEGSYSLQLAKSSGTYAVPSGDEGGTLQNGRNHSGTIALGDLDLWNFNAAAGNNVILRVGTTNFSPHLRLYGPSGTLLKQVQGNLSDTVREIAWQVTEAGAHTLVFGAYFGAGGAYDLHFAHAPAAFSTAPGDEGSDLSNGVTHAGVITPGDLDLWSFTGQPSDLMSVRVTADFSPAVRIFGPNGELVIERWGNVGDVAVEVGWAATYPGTYRAVVSGSFGLAGNYGIRLSRSRRPVVVIPGIAGSRLTGGSHTGANGNGSYLWPTIRPDKIAAVHTVAGAPDIKAIGLVERFDIAEDLGFSPIPPFEFYGPVLRYLTTHGFVRFDLAEDPARLSSSYLTDQAWALKPSLFEFPYDWRKSNVDHITTLRAYITRIRSLHGGAKVSVLAHSMGGLILRRYILAYGSDDFDKLATVGTPVWGAPQAVYRLFSGTFFGFGKPAVVDWINRNFIAESMWSMRGVAELLPSNYYFLNGGLPVFNEWQWDYNGNGHETEVYDLPAYFRVLVAEAARRKSPFDPLAVNQAFHSAVQDDWSEISDTIPVLNLVGHSRLAWFPVGTPVAVLARRGVWWHSAAGGVLASNIFEYTRIDAILGPGDQTVALLSAERSAAFRAPNTLMRHVYGGNEANHNGMLSDNPGVWPVLDTFFATGTASEVPPLAGATAAVVAAAEGDRVSLLVKGREFVTIRDSAGHENQRLTDVAALAVPDAQIRYGANSVAIDAPATKTLFVAEPSSASEASPIEIEIAMFDSANAPQSVVRYRFDPEGFAWRLEHNPAAIRLAVDRNDDAIFAPDEELTPTHQGTGSAADLTPPRVAVEIHRDATQLLVLATASDNSGSAQVLASIDDGPVSPVSGPLAFPVETARNLRVFAQDGMGNTSGLIRTAIRPQLDLSLSVSARLLLSWPIAEVYLLESADSPAGPWAEVDAPVVTNSLDQQVELPIDSTQKFYRLRSSRTER